MGYCGGVSPAESPWCVPRPPGPPASRLPHVARLRPHDGEPGLPGPLQGSRKGQAATRPGPLDSVGSNLLCGGQTASVSVRGKRSRVHAVGPVRNVEALPHQARVRAQREHSGCGRLRCATAQASTVRRWGSRIGSVGPHRGPISRRRACAVRGHRGRGGRELVIRQQAGPLASNAPTHRAWPAGAGGSIPRPLLRTWFWGDWTFAPASHWHGDHQGPLGSCRWRADAYAYGARIPQGDGLPGWLSLTESEGASHSPVGKRSAAGSRKTRNLDHTAPKGYTCRPFSPSSPAALVWSVLNA